MEALVAPFRLFIAMPLLAFLPGIALLAAGLWTRSHAPRVVLWAGIAWLVYAVWETGLFVLSRSRGEDGANIRVDLLLIAPLLLGLTLLAVVLWIRAGVSAGAR